MTRSVRVLSYDLDQRGSESRYEYLYRCIRDDIVVGRIEAGERLPSKRALAAHLGVGLVTVENAYAQLVAEGYVRAEERRGYFCQELPAIWKPGARVIAQQSTGEGGRAIAHAKRDAQAGQAAGTVRAAQSDHAALAAKTDSAPDSTSAQPPLIADFSRPGSGEADAVGSFWTRALRSCMAHESYAELFGPQPAWGNERLRTAIAVDLRGARGMDVDPARIFIGAGAQVLYGVIVKLLGTACTYAVENPGYLRLADIYASYGAPVAFAQLDEAGISVASLAATGAVVAHVTPSHQFPTGRPMPVSRRYELLSWAYEQQFRTIVEDDYDWEFRFAGKPIPPLAAVDAEGHVLYLSTFSKSLSSALRIAYMVVPERLSADLDAHVGFFANTVSVIDQVTLACTLESGAYERHLARYRNQQRRLRDALMDALHEELGDDVRICEADSGLHFVCAVATKRSEAEVAARARMRGVKLAPLSSYCHGAPAEPAEEGARFVIQYSGLAPERVDEAARAIVAACR
jgi:GntR family transcriptional regulator/MocR family aminotransferase